MKNIMEVMEKNGNRNLRIGCRRGELHTGTNHQQAVLRKIQSETIASEKMPR
jgi:hypothetical protein